MDIEQIGHVYEGLLDHTAKRATEPILGLQGTRDKEPEIPLAELEKNAAKGEKDLLAFLKDETGRSTTNPIKKALNAEIDNQLASRFRTACQDSQLWDRVKPFAGLVRLDTTDYPVVITPGSVYVTEGTDRRSSGTHYTPKCLTEPIVQYTLEPLVFVGPAEGLPREQWKLRSAKELLALKICDMACGSGAFLVQVCRYLAARLLEAWDEIRRTHPGTVRITPEGQPSTGQPGEMLIPDDPDERQTYALRIVAQRCLYGVDKNPLAVEMAKLSLWLLTLAKDKPFEFLDHAIRCGDSLVGIHNLDQLRKFNLDGKGEDNSLFLQFLDPRIKEAIELRRQLEGMQANTVEDVEAQERLLKDANEKIERLKCAADFLIAAEFTPGSAADKRAAKDDAAIKVAVHFNDSDLPTFRHEAQKALKGQATFHWPLEFPEVMVERGGFDGFVGNPPFMGGSKISGNCGTAYRNHLINELANGRSGNADLCAYFLLRVFALLRHRGVLGLIATNTICQGDTREVSLDQLAASKATIFRAIPTMRWPGSASLDIAQIWISKKAHLGKCTLCGELVDTITPHLTAGGAHYRQPQRLRSNEHLSYLGSKNTGMGFILDLEEAASLLAKDGKNGKVVLPYLNGEDLNSHPQQSASRWAIFFHNLSFEEAAAYVDCIEIVRERVKPERDRNPRKVRREKWWQFGEPTPALYKAIKDLKRVVVTARVSPTCAVAMLNTGIIFNEKLVVFPSESYALFGFLQSSLHWEWARQYTSTLGATTLNYSPSDVFETLPLPTDLLKEPIGLSIKAAALATVGEAFDRMRQDWMVKHREGLTSTHNRMHNHHETSDDIQKLRQLHVEMDNAVAAAYGWTDLDLDHGFHETKQGIRYTVSEAARREVLARLLKLNHERYEEEVSKGLHDKKKPRNTRQARKTGEAEGELFG